MMPPDEVAQVVRARCFELVDADGRTRGLFSVSEQDKRPGLRLGDKEGNLRASLRLDAEDDPLLVLSDRQARARLALRFKDADRTSQIQLLGPDESSPRLVLHVSDDMAFAEVRMGERDVSLGCKGTGVSVTLAESGRLRAMLALEDGRQPSVALCDDAGNLRCTITLQSDGRAHIGFQDSKQRLRMMVEEQEIIAVDEDGQPVAALP